jgi:nitrate/TMAO reductase-like tetraheme cytochrome c subunit
MTDEELRTLVASLATSTANNAAEARANTEAIKELRATLTDSTESQARSIEALREGMSYNTDIMANALELSAISQKTAAEALQLSANTSRNLKANCRNCHPRQSGRSDKNHQTRRPRIIAPLGRVTGHP